MVDEQPDLTRRSLRHMIARRRNERIAQLRDDRPPVVLWMAPSTLTELLLDDDPEEARTLDFEGRFFLGIPIQGDDRLAPGVVEVQWPPALPEAAPLEDGA